MASISAPENPYERLPLQITLYNPARHVPGRTYVFLGMAPARILQAARRVILGNNTFKWAADDAKALKEFFGPQWRQAVEPNVRGIVSGEKFQDNGDENAPTLGGGDENAANDEIVPLFDAGDIFLDDDALLDDGAPTTGGNEQSAPIRITFGPREDDAITGGDETVGEFGDLSIFDADDDVVLEKERLGELGGPGGPDTGRADEETGQLDAAGPPVYTDLAAWPEDTFADIREKIYVATGIPPYRQHIFWFSTTDCTRPQASYTATVAGVPEPIDIRRLGTEEDTLVLAGAPVDTRFARAARDGDVFVEALDAFRRIQCPGAEPVRRIFVADLDAVLADRTRFRAALADKLQAQLLYRGLILKYWPLLSFGAFVRYAEDRAGLAQDYPRLSPPREAVAARHAAQKDILRAVYARGPAIADRYSGARSIAITTAEVRVEPLWGPIEVNIRELFDRLATRPRLPAVAGRFHVSAAGQSRQAVTAVKTHASARGFDDSDAIARALRVPRRRALTCVLRAGDWRHGRAQLAIFTVEDSGTYTLQSQWPEDRRLTVQEAVKSLSELAAPVLAEITGMDARVFPSGGQIRPPNHADVRLRVQSIGAVAFWPRALSDDDFRRLKKAWRGHERAGLVTIRGLQEGAGFAYQFRKGIVGFDPSAIDRTVVVSTGPGGRVVREYTERTQNTYTFLTDPVVAQRWECLYGGRAVRLYHRSADMKLEIAGATEDEFRRLWLLQFAFLDGLPRQTGPRRRPPALQALREGDPELYDIRRHDARAPVYSVLCQNPRPPIALTEAEAAGLSKKDQARAVKYWNFTSNEPAWYLCPNARYPHLSFLEGRHPLGYCLPCCQKTSAFPGSRRDLINRACIKDRTFDPDQLVLGAEAHRHVLSYGKSIPPGRIGALPRAIVEQLLEAPQNAPLRLVGCRQTTGSVRRAGLFFSLSEALGEEPSALVERLCEAAQMLGKSFGALGGGAARRFGSGAALADCVRQSFGGAPNLTPFSAGGWAADSWEDIVLDLVEASYGVHTVILNDPDGAEAPDLEARPTALAALRAALHGGSDEFLVMFRIGGPRPGTYPVIAFEAQFHAAKLGKVPAGALHGTRSIFSGHYGADYADDGVIQALAEVADAGILAAAPGPLETPLPSGPDLEALETLAAKTHGMRIVLRLINMRDLCYGAVVEWKGRQTYLPLEYSAHAPDLPRPARRSAPPPDTPSKIGPRPAPGTAADVCELAALAKVTAAAVLKDPAGHFVGFAARRPGSDRPGLYYFFAPAARLPPAFAKLRGKEARLPEILIPRDTREIDRLIVEGPAGARGKNRQIADALEARNWQYRMFQAQFADAVRKERNEPQRASLLAADNPAAAEEALVAAAPEDETRLRDLLRRVRSAKGPFKKKLAAALEATRFRFDELTPARLRKLPATECRTALTSFMTPLVEFGEPSSVPNSYAACAAPTHQPQCTNGKLLVPEEDFADLVDILAADVRNPLKEGVLTLHTAGIIDDTKFEERAGEDIEVRIS